MTRERILDHAAQLGFDFCGIAPAGPVSRPEALHDWLAQGYHGTMEWIAHAPERRLDVRNVAPTAQSVVVVGFSYRVGDPDPSWLADPLRGRVARYAWGRDYHNVLGKSLKKIAEWIRTETGADARAYVDTGPVMEHEAATAAGLGFTGKNTLLIHPASGSWMHLGVVLTSLVLEYDTPTMEQGRRWAGLAPLGIPRTASCGSCVKCMVACPTRAFPKPWVLDARRCISYLTIENRGPIPEELRPLMGKWILGCDVCQEVCPWNVKFSQSKSVKYLEALPERATPMLPEFLRMDEAAFLARWAGTPLMRPKLRGMQRNALIALGNAGPDSREALDDIERLCYGPDPLLAEHAEWARSLVSGEMPQQ